MCIRDSYITFHRIAVLSEFTGRGIAQTFIQGLIEGTDAHDFRCDTPVSYTHLDVYKRQPLN